MQVGYGYGSATGGNYHALLWSGTAESVVDLNPPGFVESYANDISGEWQLGYGRGPATNGQNHALLWNGSSAKYIDLHPTSFSGSYASGISGDSQVGYGSPAMTDVSHALMWNGSAASVVDLHPTGFDSSGAFAISGDTQVGHGWGPAGGHALVWRGTSASVVDLHPYLTGLGYNFSNSSAVGIADNGMIVGYGIEGTTIYAVLWTPIPEPDSFAIVVFVTALNLMVHRRRCVIPIMPRS
jgi:hypothetical protein